MVVASSIRIFDHLNLSRNDLGQGFRGSRQVEKLFDFSLAGLVVMGFYPDRGAFDSSLHNVPPVSQATGLCFTSESRLQLQANAVISTTIDGAILPFSSQVQFDTGGKAIA